MLAYMWLNIELMSGYGSRVASTSSSPLTLSSTSSRSKFERKLGEFLKCLIESDTSVYGDGFRASQSKVNLLSYAFKWNNLTKFNLIMSSSILAQKKKKNSDQLS